MHIFGNRTILIGAATSIAILLSACGGQPAAQPDNEAAPKEGQSVPQIDTTPVTLTVFNSSMGDALFENAITKPIQSKYPFITIQMVKKEKGAMLEDLIATGSVPDILLGDSSGDIPVYRNLGVLADLTPYMKKHGFDSNRIDPVVYNTVKENFPAGQFLVLPTSVNIATLHYNRDIFDKFGVPYPKDGMTWDDVLDLAKRVTRTDGGVQYVGFHFANNILFPYNQLSAPMIDAKTMKAVVTTDKWKQIFDTLKQFYEIPGNEWGHKGDFLKGKTLAMTAGTSMFGSLPDATKNGLNWDVVALPSFKEAPNTTIQMFAPFASVSTTSKHKEQAYLAITHLLSDEGQTVNTRQGRPSVLNDPAIKQEFGKEIEVLKDRNAAAFTFNKLAPTTQAVTEYDAAAFPIIRDKFVEVVSKGKDVNTALKEAEELINKEIEKRKNQ